MGKSQGRANKAASHKSVVRSNRGSKGQAASIETPVKLPTDWPCRSASPPRLLNFYRDVLQDEDDEDDNFGFLGQSDGRSYSSTALKPGPVIQNCSGTDIQLARGAVSVTSIAKEKGRYLLLLPGLMSLKNPSQSAATAASASAKPASKASTNAGSEDDDPESEGNGKDIENLEADDDNMEKDNASSLAAPSEAITVNSTASGATSNSNSVPLLGRLERLNTATPMFKIPFPAEPTDAESSKGKKMLCFPGTKVETSSKFMILTCKKKQAGGGTVKCKDVFSSVIVFGQPHWETEEGPASDEVVVAASETSETPDPICHYGSSARAIDGVGRGKGQSGTKREQVFVSRRVSRGAAPTPAKGQNETGKGGLDDSEDDGSVELLNDSSSDEEYNAKSRATLETSASSRRAAPKRQASSKVQTYISKELSSSDDSGESDEEGGDQEESQTNLEIKEPAEKRRRTSRSNKPTSYVQADSSENEDEADEEANEDKKTTARKQQGKTPRVSGDEVGENKAEDEALLSTRAGRQQKASKKARTTRPTAKSKNGSSKNTEVVLDSSEDDDDEVPALSGPNQAKIGEDQEEDGNSESEFSGDDVDRDSDVEVTGTRRPSRRSSTARTAKIPNRVSQLELLSDSEDDDIPEDTKKKPTGGKTKTTGSKRGGSFAIPKSLDSDLDSDASIESEVDEEPSTVAKKAPSKSDKRKSLSSTTSSEEKQPRKRGRTSTAGDSNQNANLSASKTKKETPTRRRVASSSSKAKREDKMADENSSATLNMENKDVKSSSSSVKATKQRQSSSSKAKAKTSEYTLDDDDDDDEVMESPKISKSEESKHQTAATTTTASSTSNSISGGVKPSSSTSPFRSRRKKSPAGKKKNVKSPVVKVLDLTGGDDGDDGFGFLS